MENKDIGRNSEMNEKKENVKLEFDERMFELLAKDLYKDSLSFLRELATVYFKEPEGYDDSLKIFEKGLLVKSEYSSKVACLIDFNKQIKTLSRESITIESREVYKAMAKALKELCKTYLDKNRGQNKPL